MIRAAAKNFKDVAVVIDPADYQGIMYKINNGGLSEKDRTRACKKGLCKDVGI